MENNCKLFVSSGVASSCHFSEEQFVELLITVIHEKKVEVNGWIKVSSLELTHLHCFEKNNKIANVYLILRSLFTSSFIPPVVWGKHWLLPPSYRWELWDSKILQHDAATDSGRGGSRLLSKCFRHPCLRSLEYLSTLSLRISVAEVERESQSSCGFEVECSSHELLLVERKSFPLGFQPQLQRQGELSLV